MRDRIIKIISDVLVFGCMAAIFWFSNQPAKASSQMSGGITETIAAFLPGYDALSLGIQKAVFHTVEVVVRKSAHFGIYALLGGLVFFAVSRYFKRGWAQILIAFGGCALYAVSDEIHQLFVPGRSCEFKDVCIDSAGAFIGILVVFALLAIISGIRKKRTAI